MKKIPENIKEFFRKQGSKGGNKARELSTPEQRSERARIAAKAKWAKAKEVTK